MREYPINTRTHLWVPEWGMGVDALGVCGKHIQTIIWRMDKKQYPSL